MKITARDIEILKFINEFGFCEIIHIERKFNLKKPRCYQILQRLTEANLIKHERVFHAKHGAFYLTRQGATYSNLPAIKNIPKDNYQHQLTVLDIYFQLTKQFANSSWLSERYIKREKSTYCVGKKIRHLCDGVLILPDDKQIAIEVELTMKTKERLEDIIFSYVLHKRIKEVWYYCSPEIIERVRRAADDWKHVKVYGL